MARDVRLLGLKLEVGSRFKGALGRCGRRGKEKTADKDGGDNGSATIASSACTGPEPRGCAPASLCCGLEATHCCGSLSVACDG